MTRLGTLWACWGKLGVGTLAHSMRSGPVLALCPVQINEIEVTDLLPKRKPKFWA